MRERDSIVLCRIVAYDYTESIAEPQIRFEIDFA